MSNVTRRVALLFLLLLAACNPAAQAPTPIPVAPAPTNVPTAAPHPTVAPAVTHEPAPTPEPSALVLWAVADGARLDALRNVIADLSHSLGVEVTVIGKSSDGLVVDVRANVLGGLPPPDLVWGTEDELGMLQRDSLIQPANDGLQAQAFLPATITGSTLDQQRWGTPVAAQGYLLLLYNRSMVSQPPRTTDELIAQSRKLTSGDTYGLVAGWAEPRWLLAWLSGFNGALIDADGKPTLNTPEMINALNLLKELRRAGPPTPSTYDAGVKLFRQGRAAFAIDGDWSLEQYRAYSETLDLGIAALPTVPATGRVSASPVNGVYIMYGRNLAGQRRTQALRLGVALAGPEAQARIARELQLLPALRSALSDSAVTSDPVLAAAAAAATNSPSLPATVVFHCAWRAIGIELPPMLMGELAQDKAAQDMQTSTEACMQ